MTSSQRPPARPSRTDRFRGRLAAPCRCRAAQHHRRRRHVVGGGGAARHPGRFRRRPRRRLAALYARHDRLRRRRHAHGPARRPLRHRRAAGARDAGRSALGYRRGRHGAEPLAGRARPRPADRVRLLGQFRAADGRHVALVRAPARHRRRDRRLRQLSRRHDLAAGGAAFHRRQRLARDPYRHRPVPARRHAAADPAAAAAHASDHHSDAAGAAAARRQAAIAVLAAHAAGAAVHRRRRLLRGDVDAAGAYRRLLRRSRLRRRARRRDAVADARLRHRQPHRLRLHRRPHRRRAHAAARLGAAGRRAVPLSAVRRAGLALRDLGAVRPVPGRHRAELRHHRARIFLAAAKPAPASAWC